MKGLIRLFFVAIILLVHATPGLAAAGFNLPGGFRTVLGSDKGPEMMKQCSRPTPNATDFWQPLLSDIRTLESLLSDYIDKMTGPKPAPGEYGRQYIGIQIGDKMLIYGNFYPKTVGIMQNQSQPVNVCDGGPAFFGVIFDPQAQTFSDLIVNSSPGDHAP